jgi:hypothetical protein
MKENDLTLAETSFELFSTQQYEHVAKSLSKHRTTSWKYHTRKYKIYNLYKNTKALEIPDLERSPQEKISSQS